MKRLLAKLAMLAAPAAFAGTCIVGGTLERPLPGTTSSATATCAAPVSTAYASRGTSVAEIAVDAIERVRGEGLLRGAFSSGPFGLMVIVR